MEKEMAAHSSILPWKIPRTEEPGRLYSPWGCKRVRHDLVTKLPSTTTQKTLSILVTYLPAQWNPRALRISQDILLSCFAEVSPVIPLAVPFPISQPYRGQSSPIACSSLWHLGTSAQKLSNWSLEVAQGTGIQTPAYFSPNLTATIF